MSRRDFPVFDVTYLLCTGLLGLGSWLLSRWLKAHDPADTDFGGDD